MVGFAVSGSSMLRPSASEASLGCSELEGLLRDFKLTGEVEMGAERVVDDIGSCRPQRMRRQIPSWQRNVSKASQGLSRGYSDIETWWEFLFGLENQDHGGKHISGRRGKQPTSLRFTSDSWELLQSWANRSKAGQLVKDG